MRCRDCFGWIVVLAIVGCAERKDDVEELEGVEGAVTSSSSSPATTFRPVAFDIPTSHTKEAAEEIFESDDEVRKYFGESCGLVCNKPLAGPLPFTIADPPGKQGVLVYVNKPDVPEGRELVIRSIERQGNPKWVQVATCTRRAARRRSYAFAMVEVTTRASPIWVSAPKNAEGLEPCPK